MEKYFIFLYAKSKSCLISEISRSLKEDIKLKNTIERLCDNLSNLADKEINIIKNNYYEEVSSLFHDEPIAIFDDSDIAKRYGKILELAHTGTKEWQRVEKR